MARRTVRIAKTPVNETTSTKARTTNHCCRPNFFIGSSLNGRIPYEQPARTNVGKQKCRDVAIAALTFLDRSKRGLAGAIVAAYPVTLSITSREAGTVNFTEVAEACLLEVVRTLGIEALRLLTIVPSGFEALLVAVVCGRV